MLVPEDEMHLVRHAALVRTKHDRVRRLVIEFLELDAFWTLRQQLHVRTTAIQTFLQLDFILQHERLVRIVKRGFDLSRDGVVGCFGFSDQTKVLEEAGIGVGFLDGPLAGIAELLVTLGLGGF
jgi:hypothetical protein